jgi:hypothetical protein
VFFFVEQLPNYAQCHIDTRLLLFWAKNHQLAMLSQIYGENIFFSQKVLGELILESLNQE